MKTTKLCTAIALATALLFSACNKTEPENPNDNTGPNQTEEVESTAIVFTATVDCSWEGIASVCVMMDGTVKEYSVTISETDNTSATLSSNDPHYWTDSYDDITVTAWWPYTEGETTLPDVVVKAGQSTEDGFEGSNFISAEDYTVTYDNPTLTFTRRTARVTIELAVYTEGLESVKLTSLSTKNGNPAEIVPYEYDKENLTYVAHVAPQTVNADTDFITCVFDNGETFVYEMPDATEWKAGEEYTYNFFAAPDYIYDELTNTYTVYTTDGLQAWNEAAQSDLELSCTLGADITLSGTWTPIGDYDNPYTGTFEGGNHTITGLTFNQSETSFIGLIGHLGSDGKVQNLTLENVDITGNRYAGGVVGYNYGTVIACTASGSVSVTNSVVGGVVGRNYGTVSDCSASGSVSGYTYVGGVVGYNSSYGTVTACYSTGSVSGTSAVGGVVGSNSVYSTVIACYSTGSVSGSGSAVGGVVGSNSGYGTVTACYHASGNLSGVRQVGGVVGSNSSYSTMTACYWSDYDGNGTGYDYNSISDAMKVDGSTTTWSVAVDSMNSAISTWNSENADNQCDWEYVLTGDLPTLTKR